MKDIDDVRMKEINKIAHPIFLLSLILLILNDWYFKAVFHNEITGKISDFAGLFAFPFLLSILFSNHKKAIHVLTGLLFIYWNSAFSQPLINQLNSIGFPFIRTVDITDSIALISIFFSYKCLDHHVKYTIKPLLQRALIVVSSFAFMATTMPPHKNRKFVHINEEYHFDFSKRELVSRLNMIQIKEIQSINKLSGEVDFDAETNVFHYAGRKDTLALLLDYHNVGDRDTIEFKTSFAEVMITGSESNSTLKLLSVHKLIPDYREKDYQEKAIKQFEKRIIRRIKKYR